MKKVVRLTESDLHKIVKESVRKTLKTYKKKIKINETKDRFDNDAFQEWEDKEQIPENVKNMVNFVAEKIGVYPPFPDGEEETIRLRNRGGYTYGYGKGFSLSHCTSSMADGPGIDYSDTFKKWISGIGFKIVNSYGDNGMDPAGSYGRDTYWTYEFIYEPSIVYEEQFMIWGDEDDNDVYMYDDEPIYDDDDY